MTWPTNLEVELCAELGTNEGVLWYGRQDSYLNIVDGLVYLFPLSGANAGNGYPLTNINGDEYLGVIPFVGNHDGTTSEKWDYMKHGHPWARNYWGIAEESPLYQRRMVELRTRFVYGCEG
jgi:hypothetical protein